MPYLFKQSLNSRLPGGIAGPRKGASVDLDISRGRAEPIGRDARLSRRVSRMLSAY